MPELIIKDGDLGHQTWQNWEFCHHKMDPLTMIFRFSTDLTMEMHAPHPITKDLGGLLNYPKYIGILYTSVYPVYCKSSLGIMRIGATNNNHMGKLDIQRISCDTHHDMYPAIYSGNLSGILPGKKDTTYIQTFYLTFF